MLRSHLRIIVNGGGVLGGRYLALCLDFTLPSSSYATMALRELMHCDSSFETQVRLGQHGCVAMSETDVPSEAKNID